MTGDVEGAEEHAPPRWGMGDVALGIALSWIVTVVLAPVIIAVTNASDADDLPLRTVALLQVPFDGAMLGVALWASKTKGRGPRRDFGLIVRWRDALYAFVGLATQYAALLVYLPLFWLGATSADEISKPARELTDKATDSMGVVLLFLVVAIAAPIVEEIFFRGLLLRSIERRHGAKWGLVGSSAIFGSVHLQALQFPALFLFGLVAGWLALRTGRLGPSIVAHLAFNTVAVITLL